MAIKSLREDNEVTPLLRSSTDAKNKLRQEQQKLENLELQKGTRRETKVSKITVVLDKKIAKLEQKISNLDQEYAKTPEGREKLTNQKLEVYNQTIQPTEILRTLGRFSNRGVEINQKVLPLPVDDEKSSNRSSSLRLLEIGGKDALNKYKQAVYDRLVREVTNQFWKPIKDAVNISRMNRFKQTIRTGDELVDTIANNIRHLSEDKYNKLRQEKPGLPEDPLNADDDAWDTYEKCLNEALNEAKNNPELVKAADPITNIIRERLSDFDSAWELTTEEDVTNYEHDEAKNNLLRKRNGYNEFTDENYKKIDQAEAKESLVNNLEDMKSNVQRFFNAIKYKSTERGVEFTDSDTVKLTQHNEVVLNSAQRDSIISQRSQIYQNIERLLINQDYRQIDPSINKLRKDLSTKENEFQQIRPSFLSDLGATLSRGETSSQRKGRLQKEIDTMKQNLVKLEQAKEKITTLNQQESALKKKETLFKEQFRPLLVDQKIRPLIQSIPIGENMTINTLMKIFSRKLREISKITLTDDETKLIDRKKELLQEIKRAEEQFQIASQKYTNWYSTQQARISGSRW